MSGKKELDEKQLEQVNGGGAFDLWKDTIDNASMINNRATMLKVFDGLKVAINNDTKLNGNEKYALNTIMDAIINN